MTRAPEADRQHRDERRQIGHDLERVGRHVDAALSTISSAWSAAKTTHARTASAGRQPETMTAARAMNPRPPLIPDWNWC